jgi:hypothetical protein
MPANPSEVKKIFLEAVEHHAPDRWTAFLDVVCGTDLRLRERVEALLRAHGKSNPPLAEFKHNGPRPGGSTQGPLPDRSDDQ